MIPQNDVGNNHLYGVINEEATRAHDFAMAKVKIGFTGGGESYVAPFSQ